jgi:hypothetical protein
MGQLLFIFFFLSFRWLGLTHNWAGLLLLLFLLYFRWAQYGTGPTSLYYHLLNNTDHEIYSEIGVDYDQRLRLFHYTSAYELRSIAIRFVQIRQDPRQALLNSRYWIKRCHLLWWLTPVISISGERSGYTNSIALPCKTRLSPLIGDRDGDSLCAPVPLEAHWYSLVPKSIISNCDQFQWCLCWSQIRNMSLLYVYTN